MNIQLGSTDCGREISVKQIIKLMRNRDFPPWAILISILGSI